MSDDLKFQVSFRALAEDTIKEARAIGHEFSRRCREKKLALPDDDLASEFLAEVAELVLSLPEQYHETLSGTVERAAMAAWAENASRDNLDDWLHAAIARAKKARAR